MLYYLKLEDLKLCNKCGYVDNKFNQLRNHSGDKCEGLYILHLNIGSIIQQFIDTLNKFCLPCNKFFSYGNHKHCPKCNSSPDRHELRNYNMMWHDGDVHCIDCGTYVRMWDAG